MLGNLADVAAFAALALARRLRPDRALTTGDLLASADRDPDAQPTGIRDRVLAACVRAVDALLWLEARALARCPSWTLHVTARRAGREATPLDPVS